MAIPQKMQIDYIKYLQKSLSDCQTFNLSFMEAASAREPKEPAEQKPKAPRQPANSKTDQMIQEQLKIQKNLQQTIQENQETIKRLSK